MHPEKDRRTYEQSDNDRRQQVEIERLIGEEGDPKARLQLMILNRINLALIANTNVTNSIRSDLDQHLEIFAARTKEQDAMLNKGRGAWWVVTSALVGAQVLFGALWMTVRDDIKSTNAKSEAAVVRVIEVEKEQARRTAKFESYDKRFESYDKIIANVFQRVKQ